MKDSSLVRFLIRGRYLDRHGMGSGGGGAGAGA